MLRIEDLGDGIRCIGLDRAPKRNAIGVEMTLALEDTLLRTQQELAVHTLVIHGIGGHFCAGMDIKDFFDSSTRPADVLQRARSATEHWRTRLLRQMPQTIISAVEGSCFGAAIPILEASAVVFAGQSSRFGLPEINFGLVPGSQIVKSAGNAMTPRGLAYAALTGRPFNAVRAQAWGLVTEVVQGDPLVAALSFARCIQRKPAQPGQKPV